MKAQLLLIGTILLAAGLHSATARAQAMYINPQGDFGVGLDTPLAPLHIFREDETQEFLLLESNELPGPQDRAMMYLVNNGGIRFEFSNPVLGTAWRFQAATGNQDRSVVAAHGLALRAREAPHDISPPRGSRADGRDRDPRARPAVGLSSPG